MEIKVSITGIRPFLAAHPKTVKLATFLVGYTLLEFVVRFGIFTYSAYFGVPSPLQLSSDQAVGTMLTQWAKVWLGTPMATQFAGETVQAVLVLFDILWTVSLLALCFRFIFFTPKEAITLVLDGKNVNQHL